MLELTLGISVLSLGLISLLARFVLQQGTDSMRTISTALVERSLIQAASPGGGLQSLATLRTAYLHPARRSFLNLFCCRPGARLAGDLVALATFFTAPSAFASEKDLLLPDLSSVQFLGLPGNRLLMAGLV